MPSTRGGCDRCGAQRKYEDPTWSFEFMAGAVVGVICPDCGTAKEKLADAVDEAICDYAFDERGNVVARPKGAGSAEVGH